MLSPDGCFAEPKRRQSSAGGRRYRPDSIGKVPDDACVELAVGQFDTDHGPGGDALRTAQHLAACVARDRVTAAQHRLRCKVFEVRGEGGKLRLAALESARDGELESMPEGVHPRDSLHLAEVRGQTV